MIRLYGDACHMSTTERPIVTACSEQIDFDGTSLVEAGGVEPPSEKARNEENYVRIRLMIFDRHP